MGPALRWSQVLVIRVAHYFLQRLGGHIAGLRFVYVATEESTNAMVAPIVRQKHATVERFTSIGSLN